MGAITHLRKGDEVVVLSGKDKGRRERFNGFWRKRDGYCRRREPGEKHARPTKNNPQGGVIDKAMPLPAGKVMLVCPACSQPARINKERTADGFPARICNKCGKSID